MATVQLEKVQEFLTCAVCMDAYSDPCTLTCQHSFCRKCLTAYIKTRPEALQSKTIPCPSCRQVMKVPDPSKRVEEWAGQLKASIIIQGLIDTSLPGDSTTVTGRCCSVCEHQRETTPARSWCTDCEVALCDKCTKAHRGNPASRDHDISDLSEEDKVKRKRKVNCREHKKNCVEFHCKDCEKSACQTCCIIYHRSCQSVVTIESMESEMKSFLESKKYGLSKQMNARSEKVHMKKVNINEASQNRTEIKSSIRSVSQSVIDKIKEMEKKLMDRLDEVTEEQTGQLQADVKTEEIELQMYRQYSEFISQAVNSECAMNIYETYQAFKSGALAIGKNQDKETPDIQPIKDIRFTEDTVKTMRFLKSLSLGEIDVTYEVSGQISSPVLCDMIEARTESDEEDPDLRDVTVLVVDDVQIPIVTDWNNSCVKSFYTKNNKQYCSKHLLANAPWGISQLKENQVMVTIPESREIVTLEVTPELGLISSIETSKKYMGSTVLGHTSIVASVSGYQNECVDILNMSGQVMKSVTKVNNVKLFRLPWYMCVNREGNIIVSDTAETSVICLTLDGNVVWKYRYGELSRPRGITVTNTGAILVADENNSSVIQVTESGRFDRAVLTSQHGLTKPRAVFFDKHGSLFVCERGLLKEFIFI